MYNSLITYYVKFYELNKSHSVGEALFKTCDQKFPLQRLRVETECAWPKPAEDLQKSILCTGGSQYKGPEAARVLEVRRTQRDPVQLDFQQPGTNS